MTAAEKNRAVALLRRIVCDPYDTIEQDRELCNAIAEARVLFGMPNPVKRKRATPSFYGIKKLQMERQKQ